MFLTRNPIYSIYLGQAKFTKNIAYSQLRSCGHHRLMAHRHRGPSLYDINCSTKITYTHCDRRGFGQNAVVPVSEVGGEELEKHVSLCVFSLRRGSMLGHAEHQRR